MVQGNTLKALQEQLGDKIDEAQAITNLAETEERELTEEENVEIDRILNEEVPAIKSSIERREKLDKEIGNLKTARVGVQTADPSDDDKPVSSRISIPARARYHSRKLVAYKGDKAAEQAYTAGRWFAGAVLNHGSSKQWCADNGVAIKSALVEDDNTLGGVLVPDEMEQSVILLREERGVARRECNVVPMGSDVKNVPRRTSGTTAYFVDETRRLRQAIRSSTT